MYRDDVCAVCGESLPPDHFYCRRHGADVDDRLHDIGRLLPAVQRDAADLSGLLDGIAEETWDYLAERRPDDPEWPPQIPVTLTVDTEAVDVDVDREPGMVQVHLDLPLPDLLAVVARALGATDPALAAACAAAEGANATH